MECPGHNDRRGAQRHARGGHDGEPNRHPAEPLPQHAAVVLPAVAPHALHALRRLRQDLHHLAGEEGRAEFHHLLQDLTWQ